MKLMLVDLYYKGEIIKWNKLQKEERQSLCKRSPALLPGSRLFSGNSEVVHSSLEILCANSCPIFPTDSAFCIFYYASNCGWEKKRAQPMVKWIVTLPRVNVWLFTGHLFSSPSWRQTGPNKATNASFQFLDRSFSVYSILQLLIKQAN